MGDPFKNPSRHLSTGPNRPKVDLGAVNRKTNDAADAIVAIKTSKTLKVIVKPNSRNNELVGYSDEKKAWLINVRAAAEKDKANKELLSFLRKTTGKRFLIKIGAHSREKVVACI